MVVRAGLPTLALAVLLLSIPPAAAADPVTAYGVVSYSIVKEGVPPTCAGEGPFVVSYEPTSRSVLVAGTAVGCAPIWSRITNCTMDLDATVRCDKDVGGNRILITLKADGAFDYLWSAPDFHEEMHGHMDRATG